MKLARKGIDFGNKQQLKIIKMMKKILKRIKFFNRLKSYKSQLIELIKILF